MCTAFCCYLYYIHTALLIGNIHVIGLCASQHHVVCWSLILQASKRYYYYSVERHSPFDPFPLSLTFPLSLVFLHDVTDGHLPYVFLQTLYLLSKEDVPT